MWLNVRIAGAPEKHKWSQLKSQVKVKICPENDHFLFQDIIEIIPNKILFLFAENGTEQHRKTFKWNGDPKKNLFIACSTECLSVGPDDGKFAIYIDSALNQGRSQSCLTFNNDPLTPKEDFVASQVEMWTFR